MRAHLRLDGDAEDDLVAALVTAARLIVEAAARRQLVAQTWRLVLDRWPHERAVRLPLSPLIAPTRIAIDRFGGAVADLAAALRAGGRAIRPASLVGVAPEPGSRRASRSTSSSATAPPPRTCRSRSLASESSSRAGSRTAAISPADLTLPEDVAALVAPYRRPRL